MKYPNETVNYRDARDALLDLEIQQRALTEKVGAVRAALPPGGAVPEDYRFAGRDGPVTLSALFAPGKPDLFLYSYMYSDAMPTPCPLCSSFLDALNAQVRFLADRISLAVVARTSIDRLATFAAQRGWHALPLLSARDNDYPRDYCSEGPDGAQWPMANVFRQGADGRIRHVWGSEMLFAELEGNARHIDMMWPLWNVLDTTPTGRGDYYPPL